MCNEIPTKPLQPHSMSHPEVEKKENNKKKFWLIREDLVSQIMIQVIHQDFYYSQVAVCFCFITNLNDTSEAMQSVRLHFKPTIEDQWKQIQRFVYSPFRPCCFSVLAERWIELPCPPVCGNFRSGKFPSVLILATSSSARTQNKSQQDKNLVINNLVFLWYTS